MEGSEKSTRVSKTPAPNRRQVKVSVPKDHLSKVGTKSKSSRTDPVKSKNHLAWYVALNAKPLEKTISCIPQITWACPLKFCLNNSWRVAAGEGSQEAEAQKHRETTLSEVVYPQLSAIPPSPLNSPSMECEYYDNCPVPLIPIIPIEEAEVNTSAAQDNRTMTLQPLVNPSGNLALSQCHKQSLDKSPVEMLHGLEEGDLEVAAAAAATVAAVMESKEKIDTQLLIKLLTNPEMVKKLIDENGFRTKPPNAPLPAQIPNTYIPMPSSIRVNKCGQPFSQACPFISRPEAPNQSLITPYPTAETSIRNTQSLKLKPIYTSTPALLRFMPDGPPIKKTINDPMQPAHSHIHQVRPLMPSTLRPEDDETITRIINKYRGPHSTGVNPVAPINPYTLKPNIEDIKKMINEYGASNARPSMGELNEYGVCEHPSGKSFLGQNPFLLSSTALKTEMVVPLANPHVGSNALNSNFPAPPPMGLNYYKSLIRQHGQKHENEGHKLPVFGQPGNYLQGLDLAQNKISASIEMNPKYQKPCMYFNSTKGCRNGSNCTYQHDISKQQRAGALEETPVTKRSKFLN